MPELTVERVKAIRGWYDLLQRLRLKDLADAVHNWAKGKGWWDPEQSKTFMEQCTLFHSEISEAVEEWRHGHDPTEIYYAEDGKPEGIPVELADCLIRILDTSARYGIPLEQALAEKMAYNETRPYRHGGKRA